MSVDDTRCNEGLLADMTALASQIENPMPPYPVLFSQGECNGGLSGLGAQNFPQYFESVNCPNTGVPSAEDNCLRVIENFDGSFDPLSGPALLPEQVNVLPNRDNTDNNIFTDPTARLYSWYVPPQYTIVFFTLNPSIVTRDVAAGQGYLQVNNNQLQSDSCLTQQRLSNGDRFFDYIRTKEKNLDCLDPPCYYNGEVPCLRANCDCNGPDQNFPVGNYCTTSQAPIGCPGVDHHAPYFVVIQNVEYPELILDMCVDNRPISLGTSLNTLNRVWKKQAFGCDSYITNLCSIGDLAQSEFKDLCSCFTQQQALNNQYGSLLDVPVCCFGEDPSGDIQKACAFNSEAYKTGSMARNCCSFAECQKVVNNSPGMQARASPPGEIKCEGSIVQFPVPPTSPDGPQTSVSVEDSSTIPVFVWIILGVGVLLLLLFIVILAFVLPPSKVKLPPLKIKGGSSSLQTADLTTPASLGGAPYLMT